MLPTPWILPSVAGTLLSALAAWLTWQRRTAPGARPLLLLALAAGWWCLLQGVSLSLGSIEGRVLAAKVQYLGVSSAPFAWFLFAVHFTGLRRWQRPRRLLLVALPEILTLVLAWTNEHHGLIWERMRLVEGPGYMATQIEHGIWFRLRVAYAYGLVIVASLIAGFHFAYQPHHRRRLVAFLLAPLPVIVLNLIYVADLQPATMIDLTPSGFALGGLVLTWALYRHDLLGLTPISRSAVLDLVPSGVIVLDWGERILDMNRAAHRLLPSLPGGFLPQDLHAAVQELGRGAETAPLVEMDGRSFEISRTEAAGRGRSVVLLHEVTDRLRLERELRELGTELGRANEELKSLVNTDSLTGLPNRRRFMEVLSREVERTSRYRHPLALILLDLDDFKRINDTLGHPTGDAVLQELGAIVLATIRVTDLAGRLGGDEFGLLFPETTVEGARILLERLRDRIATAGFPAVNGTGLPVTVSIGVAGAAGPTTTEELLQRADDALYRAKGSGRNRVHVAGAAEGSAR